MGSGVSEPTQPSSSSRGTGGGKKKTAAQTHIGVPNDYTAVRPTTSYGFTPDDPFSQTGSVYGEERLSGFAPRYRVGQEYSIISLFPDEVTDMQRRLKAAGLLDDYIEGDGTDPNTIAAYKELLGRANLAGVDEKEMLARLSSSSKVKEGQKRGPLVVHVTDPEDLRNIARQAGRSLVGGNLPDSTIEAFVSAVQANETATQQANYALGDPEGAGGTTTNPRDPDKVLEDMVRERHPNEVAATQFGQSMDVILDTFTNRPQQTPQRGVYG